MMEQIANSSAGLSRAPIGNGKALVVGLGGCGIRILEFLHGNPRAKWLVTLAVDTDGGVLSGIRADAVINASADWNSKSYAGCGGDIIRGERAISHERANLKEHIRGFSLLIVTGGLGGGTATGGVRTLASVAREEGIPAIFLLTTPFSFEAHSRRKNADDCLQEIIPISDVVLTMPNDLLFSTLPPDTPAENAFATSAREMASTVVGIASILRCRDLVGTDFATFMRALHKRKASCGIGVGFAENSDGLDRCALALTRMLDSPFLGGSEAMKRADAAIVTLTGGPDLELGELKRTLELATDVMPKGIEIISGANVSDEAAGSVQMTAVIFQYAPESKPEPLSRRTPAPIPAAAVPVHANDELPLSFAASNNVEEVELGLQNYDKGVFEKLPAVRFRDEDLDIPTYQRRNIRIDKGS
jgi:cell division protein FtsZ